MRRALNLTVLIAGLGYFVDMFDLTIFGVVRLASLKDLQVDPSHLTEVGVRLVNLQAVGMLIGGVLWGVLGDKKGRLSVLFASIILYSCANILNAFVTSIPQYGLLRFVAGIGLAGELGAAVTLVSELLGQRDRGYGTTIIAALGLLGAVAASLIGQLLSWKTAYLIGGGLGVLLLAARFKMADSGMFSRIQKDVSRGDLRLLFTGTRWSRYLCCVLAGVPIYFITGILLTFSPEISLALGLKGITAGNALLSGSIGLTVGDLLSGLLSQWLRSRRVAVFTSLAMAGTFGAAYFSLGRLGNELFYSICFGLGLAGGYWAVLVTVSAEQFGTNIRATAATSIPNFVRSSIIPLSLSFVAMKGSLGVVNSAIIIGGCVLGTAVFAVYRLKETYGKDLDFVETAIGLQAAETPIILSTSSQPVTE